MFLESFVVDSADIFDSVGCTLVFIFGVLFAISRVVVDVLEGFDKLLFRMRDLAEQFVVEAKDTRTAVVCLALLVRAYVILEPFLRFGL